MDYWRHTGPKIDQHGLLRVIFFRTASELLSRRRTSPKLNQAEIWFAKIERDVIARGVITSVADLSRKLKKYIRLYAKSARPFRWKYTSAAE